MRDIVVKAPRPRFEAVVRIWRFGKYLNFGRLRIATPFHRSYNLVRDVSTSWDFEADIGCAMSRFVARAFAVHLKTPPLCVYSPSTALLTMFFMISLVPP